MQISSNLHSNVSRSTRINSSSVHTYIFVCFTLRVFLQGFVTQNATVISHLFPPDDEEEEEYAHVDLPQPPEPEHEEHIVTLKFPSYTSQKMREYYTQKIKKIRESNPTEYQMPHSEWTPGSRSTFARQLTKMMEGDHFCDPVIMKLAFTETGAERQQHEKHAQPQHQAPPQQQQLAQEQARGPQAPQHQAPPPPPQQQQLAQQQAQGPQAPQHQAQPPPPPQQQQLVQQQAQGPQAPQHQAQPPPPPQQAHKTSVRTKRKPDRYTPSKYESKRPRKQ